MNESPCPDKHYPLSSTGLSLSPIGAVWNTTMKKESEWIRKRNKKEMMKLGVEPQLVQETHEELDKIHGDKRNKTNKNDKNGKICEVKQKEEVLGSKLVSKLNKKIVTSAAPTLSFLSQANIHNSIHDIPIKKDETIQNTLASFKEKTDFLNNHINSFGETASKENNSLHNSENFSLLSNSETSHRRIGSRRRISFIPPESFDELELEMNKMKEELKHNCPNLNTIDEEEVKKRADRKARELQLYSIATSVAESPHDPTACSKKRRTLRAPTFKSQEYI